MSNEVADEKILTLCHEINAATYALLSSVFSFDMQNQAYNKPLIIDLHWVSVGLLKRDNNLEWFFLQNPHSRYLPCQEKYACKITQLRTKDIFDQRNKSGICELIAAMHELEIVTKKPNTFSMSYVSRNLFEITKGHNPYISLKRIRRQSFIKTYKNLVKELVEKDSQRFAQLIKSNETKRYRNLARQLMPKNTTGALIPLVQSHGHESHYIGSIIICATIDSDIWLQLPRIKSTAISLLEANRHEYYLTTNKTYNTSIYLLNILFAVPGDNLYFELPCTDIACTGDKCKISGHEDECRLVRNNYLGFNNDPQNKKLQKSLFHYHKTACKFDGSHRVKLGVALEYFSGVMGLTISPADDSHLNDYICWPTKPGIIAVLCIYDVYSALVEGTGDGRKGVLETIVDIRRTRNGYSVCSIKFVLAIKSASLASSWLSQRESGGRATRSIWRAMSGDKSEFSSRIEFHEDYKKNQEASEIKNEILGTSKSPIFFPAFYDNVVELNWSYRTSADEKNIHYTESVEATEIIKEDKFI